MILDSESRGPRNGPTTDIPNKDKAAPLPPASAPLIPHKPLPPVTPAPAVAPAKAGAQSVTPVETGAQPKPAPAAPVQPAPVKTPAVAPSPKLEGFAVQVGAFKDDEKLKDARERLAGAGVPHYTQRLDTGGGLTRLRAGPFPTREAADAALAKIKLNALDGQVVPLP
jgi:DedD protein